MNRRDFLKQTAPVVGGTAAVGGVIATESEEAEAMLFPAGNNYELLMSKPVGDICVTVTSGIAGWQALAAADIASGVPGKIMVPAGVTIAGCAIREILKRNFGRDADIIDVYRVHGSKGVVDDGDLVFQEDNRPGWLPGVFL